MNTYYRLFGWGFVLLGVLLMSWIPVLIYRMRRDPLSLLRRMWHGVLGERTARFLAWVTITIGVLAAGLAFVAAGKAFARAAGG